MKNNIQRIFRAAVCLVLVCCLIVNISPVKARAVDPATAVAFDFAARSVIASAMQGLGVSKGKVPTVFDSIVNSAVDALSTATSFISDSFVKVARFNLSSGATSFFVPLALVHSLWDWLLGDGEILTSTVGPAVSLPVGSTLANGNYPISLLYDAIVICAAYDSSSSVYNYIFYFPTMTSNDYGGKTSSGAQVFDASYHTASGGRFYVSTSSTNKWSLPWVDYRGTETTIDDIKNSLVAGDLFYENITSTYDLSLGEVGSSSQTVEEAQPTWAENIVSVPGSVYGSDDDYVPSVPIAVAPDYEGTTNMSQSDVQAGNSTWVDTETDTDTDIGTDSGTAPDALAKTVAATIAWDFISGLFDVFVPGFELISNTIEGIGALIKALPQTLKDVFGIDTLLERISAIYETVVQGFIETAAGIKSLPQAIADALAAIFVPSADYITAKVEAIRAKFPFMDSIIATGEYIRDSLSGSSGPPAIYVDLTLADGDIDYGEKTLLTDFSWYAPYKGTVDSVLGAALWAFFGWRVFLRLPGLISGADGYVGEIRTLSSRSSGAGGRKKED